MPLPAQLGLFVSFLNFTFTQSVPESKLPTYIHTYEARQVWAYTFGSGELCI